MKVATIIFCFFISISVSAQSRDTLGSDTGKPLIIVDAKPLNKHVKPLYVVDGIVYKGNIKKINPDDIVQIEVLKQPELVKIYGKVGKNGVILITTKAKLNKKADRKIDTVKSAPRDSVIYVVDGEVSNHKLSGLDPKDILSVDVLKKEKASEIFESSAKSDFIIVVTKVGAIKAYQKKLSAFSKAYSDYLVKHKGDDSEVVFIVDGEQLTGYSDRITKLFKLPIDKIKSAVFSTKSIDVRDQVTALIITTKQ